MVLKTDGEHVLQILLLKEASKIRCGFKLDSSLIETQEL